MLKALTADQVRQFDEDGCLTRLRILPADEAIALRRKLEDFERAHPEHVGKLDFKANLLLGWIDEVSRRPVLLDIMEDLLGPDLLHWNTTFRDKPPDGRAFADWHQDTQYIKLKPMLIICWLALSDSTIASGCLKAVPGSHKWPLLKHAEGGDDASILSRQQYITDDFDQTTARDLELEPGEAALINHAIVHASGANTTDDRRLGMLLDFLPTSAVKEGPRDTAMLVRGTDTFDHFDLEEQPDPGFTEANMERQRQALEAITQTMYEDSSYTPKGL